jgi:tripartite-type tricarboxylate transporter receptor subunit TctC
MRVVALAFSAALAFGGAQAAEPYPGRPLTMVVPFSAGGPTDVLARILSERMKSALGQPVLVENVTGAAGTIGVGRVAHAVADGYTLILGNLSTFVINGAVYPLGYDLLEDFEPIALVASNPQLIVAAKAVPAENLGHFVEWLKRKGDAANEGTAGLGSPAHIGGVLLQARTGTHFGFVPYRGAAPIMQDLIAGQIDFTLAQTANGLPPVLNGDIKAYAVTAETRLASAPNIPTTDEAGFPGLHISIWHGLWVPKGTPQTIIEKLNTAIVATLDDPSVRSRLGQLGIEVPPRNLQTPSGLGAYQRAEIDKWWPVIKAANIRPE